MEIHYDSEDENPPSHSEAEQLKYSHQTLNSTNEFILSQVISYVRSQLKLLSMFWY